MSDTPIQMTREILQKIFDQLYSDAIQLFFHKATLIIILIWLSIITYKIYKNGKLKEVSEK